MSRLGQRQSEQGALLGWSQHQFRVAAPDTCNQRVRVPGRANADEHKGRTEFAAQGCVTAGWRVHEIGQGVATDRVRSRAPPC